MLPVSWNAIWLVVTVDIKNRKSLQILIDKCINILTIISHFEITARSSVSNNVYICLGWGGKCNVLWKPQSRMTNTATDSTSKLSLLSWSSINMGRGTPLSLLLEIYPALYIIHRRHVQYFTLKSLMNITKT